MASSELQNETSGDPEKGKSSEDWLSHPSSFTLGVAKTIIACLAVLGNGMVIAVMLLRRRAFRSSINRLILHQSAVDGIAGVVFFCSFVLKSPSTVVVSVDGTISDEFVCRFVFTDYLLWGLNVTSTYNLVAISLERLMATCYPRRYRLAKSTSYLKLAVAPSWCIAFVYTAHQMFLVEPVQGRCQFNSMSRTLKVCLAMMVLCVEFLVPVLIMAYAYTRIMLMFKKKLANPVNARQRAICKARKNIVVTALGTSILFIICWTPTECYYVGTLLIDQVANELLYTVFTTVLACNLFVNPINYCFLYGHFRHQLKEMILRQCRGNRVQDIHI